MHCGAKTLSRWTAWAALLCAVGAAPDVVAQPADDANAVLLVRAPDLQPHRAVLKETLTSAKVRLLDDATTREELEAAALMGLRCVDDTTPACFAKLATVLRVTDVFVVTQTTPDAAAPTAETAETAGPTFAMQRFSADATTTSAGWTPLSDDREQTARYVVWALMAPQKLQGELRVLSFPATYVGASFVLDDEPLGPLPLSPPVRKVSPGEHTVSVQRGTATLWSMVFRLAPQEQADLSIPEPDATAPKTPVIVVRQDNDDTTPKDVVVIEKEAGLSGWVVGGGAAAATGGTVAVIGVALATWANFTLDGDEGTYEQRTRIQTIGRVGLATLGVGVGVVAVGGGLMSVALLE